MPRVVYTDSLFICECTFAEREIPKRVGFNWDQSRKAWYTSSVRTAVKLKEFADGTARREFARVMLKVTDSCLPLSFPPHLTLKDFQIESITHALSRNRSYQALDPGLGKSIVAVVIANTLRTKTLVISPPALARNLEVEFKRWCTNYPTIVRFDTKEAPIHRPDILIVPDSIIHRAEVQNEIEEFSKSGKEPLLIADEVHRYKNEKAIRTKALLYTIQKWFPRQVYLSGTPMPNRPMELFSILSQIAPETIGFRNRIEYGMYFCDGHLKEEICPKCRGSHARYCHYCRGQGRFEHGYDFSGDSNLDELNRNVVGPFMFRRRKVDVLKELPPKTEEMLIIGDRPAALMKLEEKLLNNIDDEDLMKELLEVEHLSTYRRELGKYKVKPAIDIIRSILEESNESLIVFAYHSEVIERLTQGLSEFNPLVVTGQTDQGDRHEIVKKFQDEKSEHRLFIGNYLAAGIGLTLTKASRVLMVEFSWVPADNEQAGDRSHRIGQTENVYVQYLIFENSIDKKMMEVCFRKKRVTGYI